MFHGSRSTHLLHQEATTQQNNIERWFSLDLQLRKDIKERSLKALGYPKSGSFAAQVVAAIGIAELGHNTDIVNDTNIVGRVRDILSLRANSDLLIAALQSIGYICESDASLLFVDIENFIDVIDGRDLSC